MATETLTTESVPLWPALSEHAIPPLENGEHLVAYSIATPGVKSATNPTVRLGPDDVPQPDALPRMLTECGGQTRLDAKGYLSGAPELVVEVAARASSLEAQDKLASYRRAGVCEYVLWRTEDQAVDWWVLEEDEYRPLAAGPDGVVRSGVFPGLWLDVPALLAGDGQKLMDTLAEGLASAEHAALAAELQKRAQAQG
jgi:hypothetical protein